MPKMAYKSFDQYWLAYLSAHSQPGTRACHYVGTSIGILGGLASAFFLTWWSLFLVAGFGYAIALLSHPLVQKNRPFATQPLWGVVSDFKMLCLAITGNLSPELERAQEQVSHVQS